MTYNHRPIVEVFTARKQLEGGGFMVRRPFPTERHDQVDPFLLLDHMGPAEYAPGEAKGAPDHPHRGFETVTYMLEGEMEHKDSANHSGKLAPGWVQWMTAGSGVVHSEMPSRDIRQNGGRVHGFQVWVNLPRKDKMTKPKYQEYPPESFPSVKFESRHPSTGDPVISSVMVISGEAYGEKSPIETKSPVTFLHFRIAPGGEAVWSVPKLNHSSGKFNVMVYLHEPGRGHFGEKEDETIAQESELVLYADTHDVPGSGTSDIVIRNPPDAPQFLSCILLAGQPLEEPMVRSGPFVMNTYEEIQAAYNDYRSGAMGAIPH